MTRGILRRARWLLAGAVLLQFTSCFTSGQFTDFVTSEFARVISNTAGQLLLLSLQGSGT